MTARYHPRRAILVGVAALAAAAVWAFHHAAAALGLLGDVTSTRLAVLYALTYGWLVWQLALAYFNRPATCTPRQQRRLDALSVAGLVPVYNEDPAALRSCLASMLAQTRPPDTVVVVDDGSSDPDSYEPVRSWLASAAASRGIRAVWVRQDNAGKRAAQMRGVAYAQRADAYWTVDSDTVSDQHALGELLKPFADPRVQSVAGVVMAGNVRRSLLTRVTDLWFLAGQLTDRSVLSVLGSVWVNSGPIAVYRGEVVRANAHLYLTEEFAGRRVGFSDDSLLTLFAMLGGRTVQQPTALAFALMPEHLGHFARMYVRWMRGSTIRSLWRVKYLPVWSFGWWLHLGRWVAVAVSSVLFVWFVLLAPLHGYGWAAVLWLAAVPVAIGYAQTLRTLVIRRSDLSAAYQWGTWLLTPLAVVFAATALRGMRWYGTFTCGRTGWLTRKAVEVVLDDATGLPAAVGDLPPTALHTAAHGPTLALAQVRSTAPVP